MQNITLRRKKQTNITPCKNIQNPLQEQTPAKKNTKKNIAKINNRPNTPCNTRTQNALPPPSKKKATGKKKKLLQKKTQNPWKKQHSEANKYSTPEQKKKKTLQGKNTSRKNVQRLAKKKLPNITKNPCEKKKATFYEKNAKKKKNCGKTIEEPLQKKLAKQNKTHCKNKKKLQ